jgi:hypothetical protein
LQFKTAEKTKHELDLVDLLYLALIWNVSCNYQDKYVENNKVIYFRCHTCIKYCASAVHCVAQNSLRQPMHAAEKYCRSHTKKMSMQCVALERVARINLIFFCAKISKHYLFAVMIRFFRETVKAQLHWQISARMSASGPARNPLHV